MHYSPDINVIALIGLTFSSIQRATDDSEVNLVTTEGRRFRFYHEQDCCESVSVESIEGTLDDLVGTPILDVTEQITSERPDGKPLPEYREESETWTIFTFTTVKGAVVIRWHGTSNGYYSESVSFREVTENA